MDEYFVGKQWTKLQKNVYRYINKNTFSWISVGIQHFISIPLIYFHALVKMSYSVILFAHFLNDALNKYK